MMFGRSRNIIRQREHNIYPKYRQAIGNRNHHHY